MSTMLMPIICLIFIFFFFNDTATTEIYTLSLHDALPISLEIAVERPDQSTDTGLGCAVLIGEGVELVNQTLGMDPAQAVLTDVELPGIVADNHGVGQEAVRLDAAPQRSLGGDQHRIGVDLQS